jgi:hypothetical protein
MHVMKYFERRGGTALSKAQDGQDASSGDKRFIGKGSELADSAVAAEVCPAVRQVNARRRRER